MKQIKKKYNIFLYSQQIQYLIKNHWFFSEIWFLFLFILSRTNQETFLKVKELFQRLIFLEYNYN